MDDRSAEIVAYAVAFTILVIGGVFLRTAILNWFVGPMTVVVTVLVLTPMLSRRRQP